MKKIFVSSVLLIFTINLLTAQSLSSYEQYLLKVLKNESKIVYAINRDLGYTIEDIIANKESPAQALYKYGHYYLFYSVLKGSKSCTETMLNMGVNINFKDPKQKNITALNIAVEKQNSSVAYTLIDNEINLNNAFIYAKKHGSQEHLNRLCEYIYYENPNNLSMLFIRNPLFIHKLQEEDYPETQRLTSQNLDLLFEKCKNQEQEYLNDLCNVLYDLNPNKINTILKENPQ